MFVLKHCLILTWRALFCTLNNPVLLAFPFNFLPDRKGKLNFGRLLIGVCFLFLSSLAVLGSSWESDDKEPASLPSRSLGDTGFDLRLRRSRLPDLTASGTCFWVRNRLSPESLQTQAHKSKWTHFSRRRITTGTCEEFTILTCLLRRFHHIPRPVPRRTRDTAIFSSHNRAGSSPGQGGTARLTESQQGHQTECNVKTCALLPWRALAKNNWQTPYREEVVAD